MIEKEISVRATQRAVTILSTMRFFPAEASARAEIGIELGLICHNEDRMGWLIRRALQLYGEWPGMRELRALYSDLWRPKDGAEAYSEKYPRNEGGGFPRHPESAIPGFTQQVAAAPEYRQISGPVSEDTHLETLIHVVAATKAMPKGGRGAGGDETRRKLLDMGFIEPTQ